MDLLGRKRSRHSSIAVAVNPEDPAGFLIAVSPCRGLRTNAARRLAVDH